MDLSIEKQIVDAGEMVETKKSKKLKTIALGGASFLFLVGIILGLALNNPKERVTITPTGTPPSIVPQPTREKRPSKYATNSALLKIESDVVSQKDTLEKTDFSEPQLSYPLIDLQIGFK